MDHMVEKDVLFKIELKSIDESPQKNNDLGSPLLKDMNKDTFFNEI